MSSLPCRRMILAAAGVFRVGSEFQKSLRPSRKASKLGKSSLATSLSEHRPAGGAISAVRQSASRVVDLGVVESFHDAQDVRHRTLRRSCCAFVPESRPALR